MPFDRGPAVYSIPPWRPFVDDLAAGLLARAGADPFTLARSHVLLPNNRAGRALTAAFVRQSAGRALLLPRISAVSDLGDQGDLGDAGFGAGLEGPAEIAPAITPVERRLILARMLHGDGARGVADSLALGDALATALDLLEIEGVSARDLGKVDPGDGLAGHWQKNLAVLALIRRRWPGLLDERGMIDATRRRNLQIDAQARQWRGAPPRPGMPWCWPGLPMRRRPWRGWRG
jgi:ATP-dependent helicase/nuclease subunit B